MKRFADALRLPPLSGRDRRAVLIGLAVLAPALLHVAAVRPYRAALQDLRDRTAAERALLEREQALIASATQMPAALQAAESRARAAAARLVSAPNLPLAEAEVTGMLETIASFSRVLLQDMRAVEPRRRDGDDVAFSTLRPLRLAIRGESDLEGVLTFLNRVESSPLLLRVIELSIEPVREGARTAGVPQGTGVVQFALTVEAFTPAEEAIP